jgi:hypothetical protein
MEDWCTFWFGERKRPPLGPVIVLPDNMRIRDLKIHDRDASGETILSFYSRKSPVFAIYRTNTRVAVQFADDSTEADAQRKAMATLNPLRGEINGLIDGWRCQPEGSSRYRRALRFDRLVADALVVAFEDDVPDAAVILARIKQEIQDERVAWARFKYLMAAFVFGLAAIGLMHLNATPDKHGASLWAAAQAGAMGAFFSIAIGIKGRTILPDLLWLANMMDAILRMIIGIIGGGVFMAILNLKLVRFGFGNVDFMSADAGAQAWLSVLVVGFLAGFSERLVPDLLAKASTQDSSDPTPPRRNPERQPAAGASNTAGGASTSAPTPDAAAEADTDHCLCTIGTHANEATSDEDLPPTSGGVAP